MATLETILSVRLLKAHLYGYVIGAIKRNSFYYEEVLKGTADREEIAAAAGNWDAAMNEEKMHFLKVTNKAPRALCMARMVATKTTITTTLATRRRTTRTMTTTDRNNKTKMKNFSNTMLECLIWQQIWRSLKVGFRGEREKGGGSN
jgi:hypothetical protein